MAKDYYQILGVAKNATEEEIKKAYRKLAHQHHPDRAGGNEAKFKEINEAYQVLSDKNKRAQYDRFGTAEPMGGFGRGPGPGFGGFGFDPSQFGDLGDLGDVMESFFEGFGGRPRRKTYEHGADLEVQEQISLEEAYRGVVKSLRLRMRVSCETCKGKGAAPGSGFEKCSTCAGQGEIRTERRTFFGSFSQVKLCDACHGTGEVPQKACAACRGSGRRDGDREVRVEILPGIEDGQLIQIRGAGEAGERGTSSGDLYVRIRVKAHPGFERRGADLIVSRELNVIDLLLGKKIDVQTLGGRVISVEIPAGFNLKELWRIPGEGMPRFNAFGRGDFFVNFIVKAPKKLDGKARKALEEQE